MADFNEIPRLSRLSAILTLLQSKRIITAAEIASKFDISKRTAYRDIRALEESGVPIFTEEGRGYSLVEGYTLSPISFTEEEANALITAEQLISRNKDKSLVANHSSAISKIKAVLRHTKKEKAEILSDRIAYFANYSNEKTSDSLSTIQKAITNLNLIKINYHSIGKNELTERIIEPQALYHASENWIMIAWCRMRNDFREFRLDRIKACQFLGEHYKSRGFLLMDYFKQVYEKRLNP
jgi:predicted DNA-binding transcriptional regulator YafY